MTIESKPVLCGSLPQLVANVAECLRAGEEVLGFDDPLKHLVGFVTRDGSKHWQIHVKTFLRHFETVQSAAKAFNNRRDYVLTLAQV